MPPPASSFRIHGTAVKALLTLSAMVAVSFVGIELYCRQLEVNEAFVDRIDDLQQPGHFQAKLRMVKAADADFKIAVLGDSLVQGRVLADVVGDGWPAATLPAKLQMKLRAARPDVKTTVFNLGIDGARVGDFYELARLLVDCDIDLLVFNVHLRTFSGDFSREEDALARPFLRSLNVPSAFQPAFPAMTSLVQRRLIDSKWVKSFSRLRENLTGLPPADTPLDEDLLMLRLAQRYSSIDLNNESAQVQDLQNLFGLVQKHKLPTIVFYASEEATRRQLLMSDDEYAKLKNSVDALFIDKEPHIDYLNQSLPSDYYLDLLAEYLMPMVLARIDSR